MGFDEFADAVDQEGIFRGSKNKWNGNNAP